MEMLFRYSRSSILILATAVLLSTFTIAQSQITPKDPGRTQWQILIPEIKAELARKHFECDDDWKIGIGQTVDVTGDGVPEAVVRTCDGGAYTDSFVLMRLEKGRPVVARERMKNGTYSYGEFLVGSSAMHSASFEVHPEQHAIYDITIDLEHEDERGATIPEVRTVDVFVWNAKTKSFDWNAALSKKLSTKH